MGPAGEVGDLTDAGVLGLVVEVGDKADTGVAEPEGDTGDFADAGAAIALAVSVAVFGVGAGG